MNLAKRTSKMKRLDEQVLNTINLSNKNSINTVTKKYYLPNSLDFYSKYKNLN